MGNNGIRIPFNRPHVGKDELRYISDALQSAHLSGDGPFTKKCHKLLEADLGTKKAFLTTSGTHALEMAALLLDIKPGDEVILPSFTFVSTANAFVLRGATPVFVDVRADTLNLDEQKISEKITSRTRCIVPVHYGGVACEMDAILEIAREKGIAVVEDNAHGLYGTYRGKFLGTFGATAAQSFHETKNISCGEGGALLVNDEALISRAEILREKGTDRSRFFRGEIDKYGWVDIGSSYLPSEVAAAHLLAQLEKRKAIRAGRQKIWNRYHETLKTWASQAGVGLPIVPPHCEQSYHLFYLMLPSLEQRQDLIAYLRVRGILAAFHYQALHSSTMGKKFGYRSGQLPVTERAADCLVRLPLYFDLKESEQAEVIQAILAWSQSAQRDAA